MASPLDGLLQRPLVRRAGSGDPARQDLGTLGDELLEQLHVFVVDVVDLVGAELTDLAPAEEDLSRSRHGHTSSPVSRSSSTGSSMTPVAAPPVPAGPLPDGLRRAARLRSSSVRTVR